MTKPSSTMKPSERQHLTSEQKLALAQADQQKWTRIAADPALIPTSVAWALGVARSAAAEVKLRQKAAAYEASKRAGLPGSPDPHGWKGDGNEDVLIDRSIRKLQSLPAERQGDGNDDQMWIG